MIQTKFIAEVSSNHNQDLKRCLQFVEQSAAIGVDAVKFQLFKLEELFAPEILAQSGKHSDRKNWELPLAFLPDIADACRDYKLEFSCTPFYLQAVEELYPFVDFYKIASYELLWDELLRECGKTGKPVMLSTGMATLSEIEQAVSTLRSAGCKNLTLFHCVSGYPAPLEECNLSAIETLRSKFDCPTGWSDHSVSAAVLYRAVHHWNAAAVEFHLDLDRQGAEYETGHCWMPAEIAPVIESIREGQKADGNGQKEPVPSELPDRIWRADPSDGLRPLKEIRKTWRPD